MITIPARRAPAAAVGIVLHGLGADGSDLQPLAGAIWDEAGADWLFPEAPLQPVTINGGMRMRAWYDIRSRRLCDWEDEDGIRKSAGRIGALIDECEQAGIAPGRIVLAGFSQGGVISLVAGISRPRALGAIVALSCYLPLAAELLAEAPAASAATPVFIAAGEQDPIMEADWAARTAEELAGRGHPLQLRSYPIGHAICPEEIADIRAFLADHMAAAPARPPLPSG